MPSLPTPKRFRRMIELGWETGARDLAGLPDYRTMLLHERAALPALGDTIYGVGDTDLEVFRISRTYRGEPTAFTEIITAHCRPLLFD